MVNVKKEFKTGDKVRISGEVEWGDVYYRVSSDGIVEDWRENESEALVTVEYIDGDYGVCTFVNKDSIFELV